MGYKEDLKRFTDFMDSFSAEEQERIWQRWTEATRDLLNRQPTRGADHGDEKANGEPANGETI